MKRGIVMLLCAALAAPVAMQGVFAQDDKQAEEKKKTRAEQRREARHKRQEERREARHEREARRHGKSSGSQAEKD